MTIGICGEAGGDPQSIPLLSLSLESTMSPCLLTWIPAARLAVQVISHPRNRPSWIIYLFSCIYSFCAPAANVVERFRLGTFLEQYYFTVIFLFLFSSTSFSRGFLFLKISSFLQFQIVPIPIF